jgi:hypothetical protein
LFVGGSNIVHSIGCHPQQSNSLSEGELPSQYSSLIMTDM